MQEYKIQSESEEEQENYSEQDYGIFQSEDSSEEEKPEEDYPNFDFEDENKEPEPEKEKESPILRKLLEDNKKIKSKWINNYDQDQQESKTSWD